MDPRMLELKNVLKNLAEERIGPEDEDWDLYGHCGGNIDDAYSMGVGDGEVILARELLLDYFKDE